jgi:hypothetical protein
MKKFMFLMFGLCLMTMSCETTPTNNEPKATDSIETVDTTVANADSVTVDSVTVDSVAAEETIAE